MSLGNFSKLLTEMTTIKSEDTTPKEDPAQIISGSDFTPDLAKVSISLIICVLGLIGNLLVIFVIVVLKEYAKSVTHWYVLQLAIADAIFLLTLPFQVSEDLNNQWIYAEWMCKGKETVLFLNYYASILFLMIMSIDRYIAVCHIVSVKVQSIRKPVSALIITLVIWASSLLLCIPVMLYSFKAGVDPNCKCSYTFPKNTTPEAICIEEGYVTNDSVQGCLRDFFNGTNKNEGIYCKKKIEVSYKLLEALILNVNEAEETATDGPGKDFGGFGDFGGVDASFLGGFGLSSFITKKEPKQNSEKSKDEPKILQQLDNSNRSIQNETNNRGLVHTNCHYYDRSDGWIGFIFFNFIAMFIFPLFVMIFCYGLIVRRLSESSRIRSSSQGSVSFTQSTVRTSVNKKRKTSTRSEKDRRRVTIMCATLVSCFVICWLPFHAVHLAKYAGIPNMESHVCNYLLTAGSLLAYLNSALNPYLYSFLGTNFSRRWRLLKKSQGFRQFISVAGRRRSAGNSGIWTSRPSKAPKTTKTALQSRLNRLSWSNGAQDSLAPIQAQKLNEEHISDNAMTVLPPAQSENQPESGLRHRPRELDRHTTTESTTLMAAAATPQQ